MTFFVTHYLKAGLIQRKDSENLVITSQYEAGIYCSRNNDSWVNDSWVNPKDNFTLRPGTKYLIVNAGGEYGVYLTKRCYLIYLISKYSDSDLLI